MFNLNIFCDFPAWLLWLLPFLLGLALGYFLWSKYKSMVADLEGRVDSLNSKVNNLESEVKQGHHTIAELEGEVAISKGKMREAEDRYNQLYKKYQSTDIDSSKSLSNSGKGKTGGSGENSRSGSSSDSGSSAGNAGIGSSGSSSSGTNGSGSGSAGSSESKASDSSTSGSGSSQKTNFETQASSLTNADTNLGASESKANTGSTLGFSGKNSIYSGLKSENLQVIEGIGPKMEEVLNENGIKNWSDLAGKSENELREILNKYGDKYNIIDVSTWQKQASFAADKNFSGLITLQKNLSGGKGDTLSESDSKLEKILIKSGAIKSYKQDDLKAIEGIGPKIEELLHNEGIKTWRELANTDISTIQSILNAAGSNFQLADPSTWPKQAQMAADGKFDELRDYQDFLQGGKE